MPLSPYSVLSLDELKDYLGVAGDAKNGALEGIANRVSDEIEQYLGRQIVKRPSALTEYHTMRASGSAVCSPELQTLDWPIIEVTSVHEDTAVPRTYGADSVLTVDVDYELVKPTGLVRRIQGLGLPIRWDTGSRAIRIVYTAGYGTPADVPARIKGVALRYAALIWAEVRNGSFGVSGQSDTLGNFTRFVPAQLTEAMKETLKPERRGSIWQSGERAA